jgi:DNA-binding winged helix-turn-helix (wHTH) protein/tetratricopeptide (TPR) repeat protein
MNGHRPSTYEFAEFLLDSDKRTLSRNGAVVPLTPKVFDTLLQMVQRPGQVLTKEELMRAIWPDSIVEENNLNQTVSMLRRVFDDRRGQNRFIATVPGTGYQFVASVTPKIISQHPTKLAVLPFENLSADPERGYLADGLTEETIAALGQIDPEHLSVISRMSVMIYKQTSKTAAEVGRELAASYLVKASLRAEGPHMRVTAGLIRVSDQVQLWSASFDSEPNSMLAFQRELSAALAEQIRLRLAPERLAVLARRQTQNAEAFDLYLRGRHFWNQLSPPTTRRAAEYYLRATQVDGSYALAWSGLADAASASPITGDIPASIAWPRAKDAVAHALAAEPNLAEVQTSLGFLKFWLDWDFLTAETAHRTAIALDPSYPLAHRMLGMALSHMGRHEEASAAIRRARELDPLVAANHALSAQVAFAARRYQAAEQFARQAIVVDPEFWIGHFQLAQALVELGKTDDAFDALTLSARSCGGNTKVLSLRGYLFAKLGRFVEATEVLTTLEVISRERFVPPYASALVYLGLRQNDTALQFLEKALDAHDVHLLFLTVDTKWDPLLADQRLQRILASCSFSGVATH